MKKHFYFIFLSAAFLSFIYTSCAPNNNAGPTPPSVFGTPTATRTFTPFISPTTTPFVTASATPTQAATLPTPAINLPAYIVAAEVKFDNFTPTNREFVVRVNNGSTDGNHASLVRVRNMTKSTACVLPYNSGSQTYRINASGGALDYFPGDIYRVEVTISGSLFVAQSPAPGAVTASPFNAITGVTLNISNNGNEDKVTVYDEQAASIIYERKEPGTAIGSVYTIPAAFFTVGQNYDVTASVTNALSKSSSVFNGLHNYSYLFISYTHGTQYYRIGVPTLTTTPTATPEIPTWTHTITRTNTEQNTPIPDDTHTSTPTPWPTDEYEPDNTYLQARLLNPGTTEANRILSPADDEDWYKINLSNPGFITITAQAYDPELYAGTYVYYYTEAGAPSLMHFWLNTGHQNIAPPSYFQYLDIGTYYIRVLSGFGHIIPYSMIYSLTELTATPSATVTASPTQTPTLTVTFALDAYEPDDTIGDAKYILKGETQNRTISPQGDIDLAVYDSPGIEIIYASIWGPAANTTSLDFTTTGSNGFFTRFEFNGNTKTVILNKPAPGQVGIRMRGDVSNVYQLRLDAVFMTATATPTVSPTHTASPTATASPTVSPTAGTWSSHASGAHTGSSKPALASNGTSFSYGYITSSSVYVNGSTINISPDPSKFGKRWLYKTSSYDYAAVVHAGGSIMAKSSADWGTNIGGTGISIGASGTMPSLFVDGSIPYIAYASNTDRRITVRRFVSSWENAGSAAFTPPVPLDKGNALSLDGINDGTLRLFLAYIDSTNGNRIGIKWKNGSENWADFGTGIVTDHAASHIDMDVVSWDEIYIQFTRNGVIPVLVRWNGSDWSEVSYTFTSSYGSDNSVYAAAYNEVYTAAYRVDTTRSAAKRFNGTTDTALNVDTGFTENNSTQPFIIKSGGVVYCAFIQSGYCMIYKYQ